MLIPQKGGESFPHKALPLALLSLHVYSSSDFTSAFCCCLLFCSFSSDHPMPFVCLPHSEFPPLFFEESVQQFYPKVYKYLYIHKNE